MNPSMDRNLNLPESLKKPLELVVGVTDSVITVKQLIEAKLGAAFPAEFQIELLELRIGERLSLPNNAKLSSLLFNSK